MNKYVIITTEGYCESPNGEVIDNCQYLGTVVAESKDAAIAKIFQQNQWIRLGGYDPLDMVAYRLHDTDA